VVKPCDDHETSSRLRHCDKFGRTVTLQQHRTNQVLFARVHRIRPDKTKKHDTMIPSTQPKPKAWLRRMLPRGSVLRFTLPTDPIGANRKEWVAAQKTGWQTCALEIDPFYTDVIVRRWQMYTGRPALLEKTEMTFEEVGEQRKPEPNASSAEDVVAANENRARA